MLSLDQCREMELAVMEAGRGRELDPRLAAHLEDCETCAIELRRQQHLSATLRSLSVRSNRHSAPPRIEQALRAELSQFSSRRRIRYAPAIGALAASLGLIWFATYRPAPPVIARSHPIATTHGAEAPPLMETAAVRIPRHHATAIKPKPTPEPFVAIPYAEPLDPWERADVVRMDLPVTALIAVGLPMEAVDPAARAMADVVVGQDGRARAVRLISISD